MIEDSAPVTYGEIQRKGIRVDGGTHVLVAAGGGGCGGHGLFSTPVRNVVGSMGGDTGKWDAGQQQQQWQQQQQQQQQYGQGCAGGQVHPQRQVCGGGLAGEYRERGETKRSEQYSRTNSGNVNDWKRVRDERFAGPGGHPAGTDRMYNASRTPPQPASPRTRTAGIPRNDPGPGASLSATWRPNAA